MRLAVAIALLTLVPSLGCESDSRQVVAQMPSQFTAPAYSCGGSGAPPPSKLILHPQRGIPDQFLVVLVDSAGDPRALAEELPSKYGGRIIAVYDAVLGGFAVEMDVERAAALADEPSVCWVEQDGVVSGDV